MIFDSDFWVTRFVFQRLLACVYLVGFLVIVNQFIPLCGEKGILPVSEFLKRTTVTESPTLFWFSSSDRFMLLLGWIGVALSVLALFGVSDSHGIYVSVLVWGALWLLYLSFVNVGQVFYAFGWETLLLETGFLCIFFGSSDVKVPILLIWLLRWLLFRLMFGAGLIKIRGDSCWKDLTCMFYHYQTQPMPNPLSWYFNFLPKPLLKGAVLFNHFAELILPFAYFFKGRIALVAGIVTILFQSLLIISGNFSWLNYLTIVLAVACFDNNSLRFLHLQVPEQLATVAAHQNSVYGLTAVVLLLSLGPVTNLFSKRQAMNASYEPFHIVNTYGAFGSITKVRREIILEGKSFEDTSEWREYEFKGKPGDVFKTPPFIAPYHLRLDWLMWFAAMSPYQYSPWLQTYLEKLLQGDRRAESLLEKNPFPGTPPATIRASLYEYRYSTPEEKKETGALWHRTYLGLYSPVLTRSQ